MTGWSDAEETQVPFLVEEDNLILATIVIKIETLGVESVTHSTLTDPTSTILALNRAIQLWVAASFHMEDLKFGIGRSIKFYGNDLYIYLNTQIYSKFYEMSRKS